MKGLFLHNNFYQRYKKDTLDDLRKNGSISIEKLLKLLKILVGLSYKRNGYCRKFTQDKNNI